MRRLNSVLMVISVLGSSLPGVLAQQKSQIEKAAEKGQNTIIIVDTKGKAEADKKAYGKPDLLFFKDGYVAEAWDLKIEGIGLEYNVLGRDQQKIPKRRQKYEVVNIQFGRTLEDFLNDQKQTKESRSPVVAPAKQQPVRHQEILAGKFYAKQGRYTKWSCTFTSQLNKYYPHARNATEYGTFVLRSVMEQPVSDKVVHKNEVLAKGKYFLYAPETFGNTDWVLNLTEVSYTENDISPRQSIYTERLRDEVFILKLSKDFNVFHLEWANQEGWQWTSPTQQTFYRAESKVKVSAKTPREKLNAARQIIWKAQNGKAQNGKTENGKLVKTGKD